MAAKKQVESRKDHVTVHLQRARKQDCKAARRIKGCELLPPQLSPVDLPSVFKHLSLLAQILSAIDFNRETPSFTSASDKADTHLVQSTYVLLGSTFSGQTDVSNDKRELAGSALY